MLRDYDLHSNIQLSKQPNLLKLLTNCLIALMSLQGKKKRKPFQQPYRNKPDFDKDSVFQFKVILLLTFFTTFCWFVLQFLKEVLTYLDDWKKSTPRSGFEKQEQKKMMLSAETQCVVQILGESLELTVTILCINLLCSLFFHRVSTIHFKDKRSHLLSV